MYLSKVLKFPQDKCVYLLGEKGLEEELDSVGIKHKGGTDPADNVVLTSPPDFSSFEKDPSVGAVLCSMDFGISESSARHSVAWSRPTAAAPRRRHDARLRAQAVGHCTSAFS